MTDPIKLDGSQVSPTCHFLIEIFKSGIFGDILGYITWEKGA